MTTLKRPCQIGPLSLSHFNFSVYNVCKHQWWAQRRCSPTGATSGRTFSVAVAAAPLLFFVTSDKQQRHCFFSQKSGSASALFLSKFSAAAATANKLLPRLFQFTFSHASVWSLHSPLVFTLLLLPRYFSLVEHTRPLWCFVVALMLYVWASFIAHGPIFSQSKLNESCGLVEGRFEQIKPISIKPISSSIFLTKMQ